MNWEQIKAKANASHRKRRNEEEELQLKICDYLKLKHPKIIFKVDLSGQFTTPRRGELNKRMRSHAGFCDIEIFEPNKKYHGLFIELKKEGYQLYKKTKKEFKSDHLIAQSQMHEQLKKRGYYATFCIGFDDTIKTINNYLNNE